MSNLHETFLDELKDIYSAESQLMKAFPRMIKAASDEKLKAAFEQHADETEAQIERLEEVFNILGEKAKGKTCKAMQGLLEEAKELIQEDAGDAALICAAQKVEHYEIASYGSLVAWSKLLGQHEATELFEETLNEEKQTDDTLTEIAETAINVEEEQEEEEETTSSRSSKSKKK